MKRPTINFVVDDEVKRRVALLQLKRSQSAGRMLKEAEIVRELLEIGLKHAEKENAEAA